MRNRLSLALTLSLAFWLYLAFSTLALPAASQEGVPAPAATPAATEAAPTAETQPTEAAPAAETQPAEAQVAPAPSQPAEAQPAAEQPAAEKATSETEAAPAAGEATPETQAAPAAGEATPEAPAAPTEGEAAPAQPAAETPKSIEELNKQLQEGGSKKIELDMKSDRPKFSLLRSDNPQDYKRTQGIWISDSGNGRIVYMKNLYGEDFYALGLAGSGLGRFLHPEQIWVDSEGRIYVADRGNNRIIRMDDMRGLGWTEMDNHFLEPRGVAFHGKRLYISDTGNNRILVYNEFGAKEPMAEFKDPKIAGPGYLWLDLEGNLYVCCGEGNFKGQIVRIPYDLTTPPSQWTVYKGQGLSGASFMPTQMVQIEDKDFLVDTSNQRLVRVDNFKGRNAWELGEYGRGNFQFLEPRGLSLDEEGKIYIADTGNDRIVCLEPKAGGSWSAYDSLEPNFGLRSPRSVFVWSPQPPPEEEEGTEGEEGQEAE